jgi:hypothetical protein
MEKTKKQVAIAAAYSNEKPALCWIAVQKAGKLYEDKDSHSFMENAIGKRGHGFPPVCSGHGMRAGRPCRSRAKEMIGLQWP